MCVCVCEREGDTVTQQRLVCLCERESERETVTSQRSVQHVRNSLNRGLFANT